VAMFGWLAASSLVDLQTIWIVPNLLGSALTAHPAFQRGFGWTTVSGLGLHLFASGLLGMVFGLLAGATRRQLRVTLLGIVVGLAWYYFSQALFWRRLGVLVTLYSPPQPLFLAHLAYGIVLGWFPSRLRALERASSGTVVPLQMTETLPTPDGVE
jgi:hypothetical protein